MPPRVFIVERRRNRSMTDLAFRSQKCSIHAASGTNSQVVAARTCRTYLQIRSGHQRHDRRYLVSPGPPDEINLGHEVGAR
eukprot:815828-Pyramimonas_sp.AAC.1